MPVSNNLIREFRQHYRLKSHMTAPKVERLVKLGVPKQAIDFVERRQREWRQSLPPILKMEILRGKDRVRVKKQFLRSGVHWEWDKPTPIAWQYYLPVPGRTADRKPRIRAQRIAEAMQSMPDLIAEYREETKRWCLEKRAEKRLNVEREKLLKAASTRLSDMRSLVKEFDALDDSFFDGDDNYYKLLNDRNNAMGDKQVLAKASALENNGDNEDKEDSAEDVDNESENMEDGEVEETTLGRRREKITQWRRMQNRRKLRSEKFAKMLQSKPLLSPELDNFQEKIENSRCWEKLDPEDGDYDDGKTWLVRRTEKEIAYLQQLANEPNLEKEEEKHSKHRVTPK